MDLVKETKTELLLGVMPDLCGLTIRKAIQVAARKYLLKIMGSGIVRRQSIQPGSALLIIPPALLRLLYEIKRYLAYISGASNTVNYQGMEEGQNLKVKYVLIVVKFKQEISLFA